MRLSWRLYLRCSVLVILALLVAAFSFGDRQAPMRSTLAPETFDGADAYALLEKMSTLVGEQGLATSARSAGVTPGSAADRRLESFISRSLAAMGGPDSGGYDVSALRVQAQTSLGGRRLTVLVARRAGASTAPGILLIAHRDTAGAGVRAQLSGDAALLEIAGVLASTETTRPVTIVFSDGGASGAAGTAAYLGSASHAPTDAAIVLGDLAGGTVRQPLVQPFSSALGSAPEVLERTVAAPLSAQLSVRPRPPSFLAELAHRVFPYTVGEQGLIGGQGTPAVAVDFAGERGYDDGAGRVSEERLQRAGRAVLSAFYALDGGQRVGPSANAGLMIGSRTVPGWALRLLIGSLLLGPLALAFDALARSRARKQPVLRWLGLALACAAPVFAAAVVVELCGLAGLMSAPSAPARAAALSLGRGDIATLALALVALLACCGLWWRLRAKLRVQAGASMAEGVALAALAAGSVLGVIVWIANPYAALLIVPALHACLLALSALQRREPRPLTLALVIVPAALGVGLLLLYYSLYLGLGPSQLLGSALIMLAGGYVGFGAVLAWAIALGLLAAMAIVASSVSGVSRRRSPPRASRDLAPRRSVLRRVESDIFLGAGRR